MANHKAPNKDLSGGEPGAEQQSARRDRENMGAGQGSQSHGKNQGREGGRGSGRHGHSEKGDAVRSARK
ncbi:MAG TPA: hypothetical protein VFP84_03295 [Kofleriaceae bacterium]|nr:hypothetical protein [Kofleriaceae bacterium]